jgi:hypothetical protein
LIGARLSFAKNKFRLLMCNCLYSSVLNLAKSVEYICPKYDQIIGEKLIIKKVGIEGMWVEKLLGDASRIKYPLEYVKSTTRFTC